MLDQISSEIENLAPEAERLFYEIAKISSDGSGITRPAFCRQETAAGDIIRKFAELEGLSCGIDGVGNFQYELPGSDNGSMVIMGSHLDSVPVGGNYDGLAGVIGGVLVQVACKRLSIAPPHKLRTIGFRGEESPWFGIAYVGSRLLLGQLTKAELEKLKHKITGKTLAQHLEELGIKTSEVSLSKNRLAVDSVRAYLELHIEQGPVLESKGIPIGAATAIRGNIRHPFAVCRGEYGHSAAVPRNLRRDAVIATARFIAKADQFWKELFDTGNHDDLIVTFGILSTNHAEHAMTKIPGETNFSFAISSINNTVLAKLYNDLMAEARKIEKELNVSFDFGQQAGTEAVRLSDEFIVKTETTAKELHLSSMRIPTVGHDAALFARAGIPTGVIIVKNQNGSHNIHEAMKIDDFLGATKVLASCALI